MATTKGKIRIKLVTDKTRKKVLFAEAGKEFVDFILHILSLPLGTVVKHLTKELDSIRSIYRSLENLSTSHLQEGLNKDCLLNPKPASGSASDIPLLTVKPAAPGDLGAKTFYVCASYKGFHPHVSDGPGAKCLSCEGQLSVPMKYVAPPAPVEKNEGSLGGYVKEVVTYMIMDDLSVQPMSITHLKKFNVQDVGIEEREFALDFNLRVALLKESVVSKTVLTNVILPNKSAARSN